jgi:hypothetical protein
MKTRAFLSLLPLAASCFSMPFIPQARAANDYNVNIVGYVNVYFMPGDTLFGNPLNEGTNNLGSLFRSTPDGATVSLWDSATQSYLPVSSYDTDSGWSINYEIPVGMGALLQTGAGFTNTFVGQVLLGPVQASILPHHPFWDYIFFQACFPRRIEPSRTSSDAVPSMESL